MPVTRGTTVDQGNSLPVDTVYAVNLSDAVETVSGRELVRSTVRTIRGRLALTITPTAANTFTRARVAGGIAWAPDDLITGDNVDVDHLNPLNDEYDWVWRHLWMINYAPERAVAGDRINDYGGLISLYSNRARKQPSVKHGLYLFMGRDDSDDANITSINFSVQATVGIVVR